MSSLFEEAIADAKKLKEVAEQNAKNAIIESISPVIKQMIEKEVSSFGSMLFEEEETPSLEKNTTEEEPPISAGKAGELDVPLPDEEGKITVDFDNLFDKTSGDEAPQVSAAAEPAEPEAGAALAPTPALPGVEAGETGELPTGGGEGEVAAALGGEEVPPVPAPEEETPPLTETDAVTYESYRLKFETLKTKIDSMGTLSEVQKSFFNEKLLGLYEMLETLAISKKIPTKVLSLNESALEFLYKKLKESKVANNYNRSSNFADKGRIDMKSLKEFANNLFEEADAAFNTEKKMAVTNSSDKTAEKAGKHAMKATEPDVDTSKSDAPKGPGSLEENEKMWAEELSRLEEELKELGDEEESVDEAKEEEVDESHGMSSGGEMLGPAQQSRKEDVEEVYELDDDELEEAVRSIRKEAIKRKMKALKEEYEDLEERKEEDEDDLDESSHKDEDDEDLDESMRKDDEDEEELDECGMDMEHLGGDMGHDVHDVNIHLDLSGLDDDDSVELVDDDDAMMSEPEDSMDMEMGDEDMEGEEDSMDEEWEEGKPMGESKKSNKSSLKESKKTKKVVKGKKPAAKTVTEAKAVKVVKNLKNQLAENQLLTAKLIYLSKFLQRDNLSRKQKQKIVEYLDNAKTVEEAKQVYGRIKKVLDESVSSRTGVGGSSSKVTKSGSATLNEGSEVDGSLISEHRWMKLAGINKRG